MINPKGGKVFMRESRTWGSGIGLRRGIIAGMLALALLLAAAVASADHSWGSYHWARTANPFTLKLGDNVSSAWDAYLAEASDDWSASSVLDTTVVAGGANPKNCRPTSGRVEVCNSKYGNNGWLGVATIWSSGSHITQGTVKVNDTYFNTATYNTPAWRRLVMCQEIGHTFGLDHQDENFDNPNLGSCMDYTSDPDGPPSNEHPNAHDYEQLELIYAHLDSTTTVGQFLGAAAARASAGNGDDEEWGKPTGKKDGKGRDILFEKNLGGGKKKLTWVLWANGTH
jgi:hypothetical protein